MIQRKEKIILGISKFLNETFVSVKKLIRSKYVIFVAKNYAITEINISNILFYVCGIK